MTFTKKYEKNPLIPEVEGGGGQGENSRSINLIEKCLNTSSFTFKG